MRKVDLWILAVSFAVAVAFVCTAATAQSLGSVKSTASANRSVVQYGSLPTWYPSPGTWYSRPLLPPGTVIVGSIVRSPFMTVSPPPIVDPPIIAGPTYYWHEGYWYRSELTGYQWRWRNGHWCTNPNRH